MYYAIVAGLMLLFPAASMLADAVLHDVPFGSALVAKWYVFWAVGVRLLLAGLRQIFQPGYTARTILGIEGNESLLLVRELGFANVAFGVLGAATLTWPAWVTAAALAGGIFYALAGVNHVLQPHRNKLENVAMVSDLFAASVLLACCWRVAT